jgi:Uncharacterized protein conserved in bacteria
MKRIVLLLMVVLCFMLSGCVKQEEYDELNDTLTKTKQANALLNSNNEELKAQVAELEAQVSSLQNQVTELQAQIDKNNTPEALPENDAADEIEQEAPDFQFDVANITFRTDVTYDDLSRKPDDYLYEYIEVSGEVVQLIEGDDENQIRVALNSNGYDDVILCGYDPSIMEQRILEEDSVTIKGMSVGIYQYESTLGGLISVPAIYGLEITIN